MKKMLCVVLLCVVGIMVAGLGSGIAADQQKQGKQADQETVGLIDINTATAEELATLDGIGNAYAERIISFRETYGRFITIEALKDVKGIGDRTFERNRHRITVGQSDPR